VARRLGAPGAGRALSSGRSSSSSRLRGRRVGGFNGHGTFVRICKIDSRVREEVADLGRQKDGRMLTKKLKPTPPPPRCNVVIVRRSLRVFSKRGSLLSSPSRLFLFSPTLFSRQQNGRAWTDHDAQAIFVRSRLSLNKSTTQHPQKGLLTTYDDNHEARCWNNYRCDGDASLALFGCGTRNGRRNSVVRCF